ncbi:pyridoxal-phosphate dependent enzyme [Caldithrix abyssi]|nr:pyridoxal-phosphate dependent enzyme [Caldithrix abyssi]
MIEKTRRQRFKQIESTIGSTHLHEIETIEIPNGNRIFCKEEWTNPTGSHYDRVYIKLLYEYEKAGKIIPGETHLVETTSGNAGVAFAWLANELGYSATVIIPEDMPKPRVYEMQDYGAEIIFSKAGQYVKGVVRKLREYLIQYKNAHNNPAFCLDHSRRKTSFIALYSIAKEINQQLSEQGLSPDYFIGAIGNGTTTVGIYNYFKDKGKPIKMFGVEPFESPVFFNQKFPGRFKNNYGKEPEFKAHNLIGAGGWGVKFPNVHLDTFEDIYLCKENKWQEYVDILQYSEKKPVGRTSAACILSAVRLSEKIKNKNIFTLFYDPLWKYKSIFNGKVLKVRG